MALNKWWTPARVVHRGAWWVFIVITLVVGSVRWVGFGSYNEVTYHGSYTPLNGVETSKSYATSLNISYDVAGGRLNWLTALSLVAFVTVMATAIFEAVVIRHRVRSAATVAGPLVALFVVAVSLNGTGHDVVKPLLTVAGVLIAVAVHEGCMAVAGPIAIPDR